MRLVAVLGLGLLAILGALLLAEVVMYGAVAGGRAAAAGFVPSGLARGVVFALVLAGATGGLLWALKGVVGRR